MDENGVVEEDTRPWVTLVVLAEKPHQENVTWNEYQWRLCVSYKKLNQVTSSFAFPITRYNDSVQDIVTEAKYFIAMEIYSCHWRVVEEEEVCERLELFTSDGK